MFVVFSHILAFTVLFIDSLFDVLNDHNVPDEFAVAGIIGGLLLHAAQSFYTGSFTPLIWSVGGAVVAGVYGWAAYYKGLWGGADAMILTMMGATVPLTVAGEASSTHVLDLVFNFMVAAVVVTVIYAAYKFMEADESIEKFRQSLSERKRVVTGLVIGIGVFSILMHHTGGNGLLFFLVMTGLLFLYEWVRVVEQHFLIKTVSKEEALNEVPAEGQGFDEQIKGLTEEDLEDFDGEEVDVRTGVPLIPVFLVALLLTNLTEIGFWLLFAIY